MQSLSIRLTLWGAAAVVLLTLLGEAATWTLHQREVDAVPDEAKIARTLEIIRTSTPTDRKVLKVLFYGQSITRSGWHTAVVDHWRQKYPNTVFVVENRALGGFDAQALERTTEQDIAAFYPDLIVFHVYGDHRAYERIIRMLRSRTAADVIVQTDHAEVLPDAPCAEGLSLSLHRAPGCAGWVWVHQRLWQDEMSYHKIPALAKKYGLAMERQRGWWRDYLLRTQVDPKSMLVDQIHPNAKGKEVIAEFFSAYFDDLVAKWNRQREDHVQSLPPGGTDGQGTVEFDGSRIELVTVKPLAQLPAVTVDGGAAKDLDGCYLVSRASSVGTVPDWPALRRIELVHDRTPEEWTATLNNFSADQRTFDFTLAGSVSGEQGQGTGDKDFAAKSGQLKIEAKDWMVERAFELKHVPLQGQFTVRWTVEDVCDSAPEPIDKGDGTAQYRYVLATGLGNGRHTVKVAVDPGSRGVVTGFLVYQPPLNQ